MDPARCMLLHPDDTLYALHVAARAERWRATEYLADGEPAMARRCFDRAKRLDETIDALVDDLTERGL